MLANVIITLSLAFTILILAIVALAPLIVLLAVLGFMTGAIGAAASSLKYSRRSVRDDVVDAMVTYDRSWKGMNSRRK